MRGWGCRETVVYSVQEAACDAEINLWKSLLSLQYAGNSRWGSLLWYPIIVCDRAKSSSMWTELWQLCKAHLCVCVCVFPDTFILCLIHLILEILFEGTGWKISAKSLAQMLYSHMPPIWKISRAFWYYSACECEKSFRLPCNYHVKHPSQQTSKLFQTTFTALPLDNYHLTGSCSSLANMNHPNRSGTFIIMMVLFGRQSAV